MTDTKRIRELVYLCGPTLNHKEGEKLYALVLAACDELERLREERATTRKRLGIECHDTDTAERARLTVLQSDLFRTENEKLRAALVQANDIAEGYISGIKPNSPDVQTMRANLKEFTK
jgi:hypothetical protein